MTSATEKATAQGRNPQVKLRLMQGMGTKQFRTPEKATQILGLHSISRDSNGKGYGGHVGVHNKRM